MRSLLVLALVAAAVAVVEADTPPRTSSLEGLFARLAGRLLIRLEPGEGITALTAAGGDVWAHDRGGGRLLRLDGRSGRVVAALPLGERALFAPQGGSVWALRWGGRFWRTPNGPLYRIDARTNRVRARIPLRTPAGGQMVAFGVLPGDGGVWVWGPSIVQRLEPATGRVFEKYRLGPGYGELTGAARTGGGIVAATGGGHVVRFQGGEVRVGPREPAVAGAQLAGTRDGGVYAAAGGTLTAVDAGTGRLGWRRALGFRISEVLDSRDALLVLGGALGDPGDRIWALDRTTGRILASLVLPSFGTTAMTAARGGLWVGTSAGEVIVVPPLLTRLFLARARAAASPERRPPGR